jgi:ferric-dicitrate binding protein FerR (iron transport regulator)
LTTGNPKADDPVPLPLVAEASVWLARLHDDGRNGQDEAGFRHWLMSDEAHARAFALVTEAWHLAGALQFGAPERSPEARHATREKNTED